MPTSRIIEVLTILLILNTILPNGILNINKPQPTNILASIASSPSPQVDSALSWLAHDYSGWSKGFEGGLAPAAYALWLNDSGSTYAASSYAYLMRQLDNSSTWFWSGHYREADVAGEVLLSIAMSQHLSLSQDLLGISSRLLHLQLSSGGFEGYQDSTGRTVTSSVDTAMALWGLSLARTLPAENRTAAATYLLGLINEDGSFNLTRTVSADRFYSLGPDVFSITALATLALGQNGFGPTDPGILKAVDFMSKAASAGFSGPGHVYDSALSTLVFLENYRPREAAIALAYLSAQQNSDGGFGDVSRSNSRVSNALDTGWAAVALQFGIVESVIIRGPVNQTPTARFSLSPREPVNGIAVSFDAGSSHDSDNDSLSYAWTFGDGGSASGLRVTHTYAMNGVYTVTLTVTDSGANPAALSNTTWLNVTVLQSQVPARAATSPTPPTSNVLIALAALLAAAVVAGYLILRTSRRRKPHK